METAHDTHNYIPISFPFSSFAVFSFPLSLFLSLSHYTHFLHHFHPLLIQMCSREDFFLLPIFSLFPRFNPSHFVRSLSLYSPFTLPPFLSHPLFHRFRNSIHSKIIWSGYYFSRLPFGSLFSLSFSLSFFFLSLFHFLCFCFSLSLLEHSIHVPSIFSSVEASRSWEGERQWRGTKCGVRGYGYCVWKKGMKNVFDWFTIHVFEWIWRTILIIIITFIISIVESGKVRKEEGKKKWTQKENWEWKQRKKIEKEWEGRRNGVRK